MRCWSHCLLLGIVTAVQPLVAAVDIESFENKMPEGVLPDQGVSLSLTKGESVHGRSALLIRWDGRGGAIQINRPIAAGNQIVRQREHAAVFHVWLYREAPLAGKSLRFEFGVAGQDEAKCWFDYQLGYSGWRTVMMPYNRMAGKEQPKMGWMRIRTPKGKAGQVVMDLLLPSVQFDRRHASQDQSYQFSRDDERSRQREGNPIDLYHQNIREIPDVKLTPQQTKDIKALEHRLERYLLKNSKPSGLEPLKKRYAVYGIKQDGSKIKGNHIFYLHTADIYKGLSINSQIKSQLKYDLRNTGKLLLALAYQWHSMREDDPDRLEVEEMIVSLQKLLLKSGWHEGHGQGTLHHFGYSSREYYTASFLTRSLLERHGLRRRVARSLQWFNDSHYCYDSFATTHYANLDYFNTLALPQLMALLMTEADGERYSAVKQWSQMLSGAIANDRHGSNGGFKEDGTAFHHWGHYPAYETGALRSLASLFLLLSDTPFRLTPDAYQCFKKAMLVIRLQSNLHSWPRSLSGRHPYSQEGIAGLKKAFVEFSRSGTADGKQAIDHEMAAATIRLFPETANEFPSVKAESHPSGHWVLPYAHAGIHRRDDWLAVARGLSRYVWGSEIYGSVNRYGRYQSHGTLEILPLGGLRASGVGEGGWDWSRPPGATMTRLPMKEIPFESIIMMPTTDETMVGGCHMDQRDGMWAMVLKEKPESGRPDVGLYAQKSYSFFDDMIVCLGSSIASPSKKYPTETVLFQQYLTSKENPIEVNAKKVDAFPYAAQESSITTLRDVVGNCYRIPAGQSLHVVRQHQHSHYHYATRKDAKKNYKNRDASNDGTEGDYAVAWIDHGIGAKTASYHYAMLVYPDNQRAKQWYANPGYTILQHDAVAHIVRFKNTTNHAIFKMGGKLTKSIVTSVSAPCLIITQDTGKVLKLNLTDPDLRLPGNEGGSIPGEIFVPTGNGKEVSTVSITLRGRYSISKGEGIVARHSGDQTTLIFTTLRGRTIPCELVKTEP